MGVCVLATRIDLCGCCTNIWNLMSPIHIVAHDTYAGDEVNDHSRLHVTDAAPSSPFHGTKACNT